MVQMTGSALNQNFMPKLSDDLSHTHKLKV